MKVASRTRRANGDSVREVYFVFVFPCWLVSHTLMHYRAFLLFSQLDGWWVRFIGRRDVSCVEENKRYHVGEGGGLVMMCTM